MMQGWGVDVDNVTLGIMIEIPSSAIMIEDFLQAGIKFASFGTNDLIQYRSPSTGTTRTWPSRGTSTAPRSPATPAIWAR